MDELTLPKYKNALQNLVSIKNSTFHIHGMEIVVNISFQNEYYKKTPLKSRHNIVRPLRKANFSRTEIRKLGFPVGKKLWKNCENANERNIGS